MLEYALQMLNMCDITATMAPAASILDSYTSLMRCLRAEDQVSILASLYCVWRRVG